MAWLCIFYAGMKRPSGFTSSLNKSSVVKKVEFNINPSYSKPTLTLLKPSSQQYGYTLERALNFRFPCFATIYLDEKKIGRKLPPAKLEYWTRFRAHKQRVVLSFEYSPTPARRSSSPSSGRREPNRSRGKRGMKPVVYDAELGDGWVLYDSDDEDDADGDTRERSDPRPRYNRLERHRLKETHPSEMDKEDRTVQ
mmetsp:Transcript_28754/g.48806  ORF Transcript_28754/g.48806 Transcript_28754/m.48806 type:complete len:196 (+) Transcript_28754:809-1396(+)